MKQKLTVIFLIISIMLAFTNPNFADDKPAYMHLFNETSFSEPGFDALSPFRTNELGEVEIFYGIISKLNQPRNTNGTSPHGGVDIKANAGTHVYPIADGKVVSIDWDTSGQMGTVFIEHGDFIVLYRHIVPDSGLYTNQEVTYNETIGIVDEIKEYTPAHLHISWCANEASSYPANKLFNLYDHVEDYNYGRDCDFFSEPYINGNSLYIYAYSKSMSGPKNVTNIKLYYKIGNGSWNSNPKQMVPVVPANYLWKFDFSGLPENPQPGQTIEYYLVGYRDDTEVYDKKAFYPSYYYRPPELPSGYNTSDFNYPPMTKTFTIPSPGCNHSWTDCLDAICNICGYTRIAPGHSLSPYGAWIDISTESQCEKQKNVCNNCSYWTWCIDTTHAYTNCADTTCNKCQYSRIAPGHSLSYGTWVAVGTSSQCEKQQIWCNNCSYSNWIFDNTHEYYDCTDSTCTRCGYSRTAPGHSLSPSGSWIDISTASQCEKQKIVCNNCSYSDWVIDTTHAWTNACDTRCNDCNYTRTISHSYTAIGWVDVSQSDICKDYVYRCKICGNSYIAYSDYDHDWSYECDSSCNDCGYTRYANHSYSGSWVNVCTSSICQKYEYECYYCGDSYVSHYDYTHYYPSEFEPICSDCGYRDW